MIEIVNLDFVHGIFCGIAALGSERGKAELLSAWDFYGERGHIAAEAAYQYLQLRPDCQLHFAIFRNSIYGESLVWSDIVDFEWDHGSIRPFSPLGSGPRDFFVDPLYNDFDMVKVSPEERDIWVDCAWVYANAYGRFRD